jgi:hypothetical protein
MIKNLVGVVHVDRERLCLQLWPPTDVLFILHIYECGKPWWNYTYKRKTCPSATFSTTNCKWTALPKETVCMASFVKTTVEYLWVILKSRPVVSPRSQIGTIPAPTEAPQRAEFYPTSLYLCLFSMDRHPICHWPHSWPIVSDSRLANPVHWTPIQPRSFRARLTHPWWWRQHVPLKRRSTIILHGSTSQKTFLNFILAAVRTWNLRRLKPFIYLSLI